MCHSNQLNESLKTHVNLAAMIPPWDKTTQDNGTAQVAKDALNCLLMLRPWAMHKPAHRKLNIRPRNAYINEAANSRLIECDIKMFSSIMRTKL